MPFDDEPDLPDTLSTVLIALVAVLAAVVIWRASVARNRAAEADFAGIRAVANQQETLCLGSMRAYEHARAYAAYRRYLDAADILSQEEEKASDPVAEELARHRAEADALADSRLESFPNRFMRREGESTVYETGRDLGQYLSDAARSRDIKPSPHFERAERYGRKAGMLLWGLVGLSLSLVLLTLAKTLPGLPGRVLLGLGLLTCLAAAGGAGWVEWTQ